MREVCGADLEGRQGVTCSDKCRAARWRRQRETTRQVRDREIRELLEAAMRALARDDRMEVRHDRS